MKYVLVAVAVLVLIVVVVLVVGWTLPEEHRVTREATYRATPAAVFRAITDVKAFPQWRPSVQKVEVPDSTGAHTQFREIGKNGSILFQIDSLEPNHHLVTRIADRSLPFGGKWSYEIVPSGDSTTLRITEDGEIYNPVYRFASRFIMGYTATIDEYLLDLGKRLGPRAEDQVH